jgi:hypothetical protein
MYCAAAAARSQRALRSGSSSSSSSSSAEGSAHSAPCSAAAALLQVAGACLTLIQQSLGSLLQDSERQHQQIAEALRLQFELSCYSSLEEKADLLQQHLQRLQQGDPHIDNSLLVDVLQQILQHVVLLGRQLQRLLLPGNRKAAAAALHGLQEKQQQLQQLLRAALWRLSRAQDQDVQFAELIFQEPPESFEATAVDHAEQQGQAAELQAMLPEVAAMLVGPRLLLQLSDFGCALWSALPQPHCCNNVACINFGSISEAKLVSGKGSRCSKCQVAR